MLEPSNLKQLDKKEFSSIADLYNLLCSNNPMISGKLTMTVSYISQLSLTDLDELDVKNLVTTTNMSDTFTTFAINSYFGFLLIIRLVIEYLLFKYNYFFIN